MLIRLILQLQSFQNYTLASIFLTRLIEKKLDKIVLDEIGIAISLGFIEENDLISMINNRPSSTDIILTGPSIPPKVIDMADQITQLRCN